MKILGIETSCDETAAAVIEGKKVGAQNFVSVLSNVVSSQINLHKKYGGIVPEVAAREHVLNVLPVINEAISGAISPHQSASVRISPRLDAIAVTIGPGLITSLIVGIETAKALAYAWNIPVIGVNHIEGHIYANFINERSDPPSEAILRAKRSSERSDIKFPAIILTVSGGHTMLVLMTDHGQYKTIGQTRDDAAGEAFDKAATLLNLGFPGGPIISKIADKYIKQHPKISNFQFPISKQIQNQKLKNQNKISLPRPMINDKGFDFSFSGLKTALLYAIKSDPNYKLQIPNYSHEFQQAIIDVLIAKTIKAAQKHKAKTVMLTGGVAANNELRKQLEQAVKKNLPARNATQA